MTFILKARASGIFKTADFFSNFPTFQFSTLREGPKKKGSVTCVLYEEKPLQPVPNLHFITQAHALISFVCMAAFL